MDAIQLILCLLVFLRQDHGFDRQIWHFDRLLLRSLVGFRVRRRRRPLLHLDMQQHFHVLLLLLSRHAVETALLVLVQVTH